MSCETIVAMARTLGREYVYCIDSDGFMKIIVYPQPKDLVPVMAVNNPIPTMKGKIMAYAVARDIAYTPENLSKALNELAKLLGVKKVYKAVVRHAKNIRNLHTA